MVNIFYNPSGSPATGSQGLSSVQRREFAAISTAFDLMPQINTTGQFTTVFNQQGNFTFTLPAVSGTFALSADVVAEITRATSAEALLAPLASPNLTGTPTAPTPASLDHSTTIANTTWVANFLAASGFAPAGASPVVTVAGRTGAVVLTHNDITDWTASVNTAVATEATARTAADALVINTGRNWLHNGAFRVRQRGNGPWGVAGNYTADRWQINATIDTMSFAIATLTDADRTAIGDTSARFALQNTFSGSAGTNAFNLDVQKIEGVLRLAGKTVTYSFWARSTAGTPKLGASIIQIFGTGGSPSTLVTGAGSSVTINTTWTRYSITLTIPSAVGKILGTNGDDHSQLNLWYSSGSANAVESGSIGAQSASILTWGRKLNNGTVATSFEQDDAAAELASCQRFYQIGNFRLAGYGGSGNGVEFSQALQVTMRAVPVVVAAGTVATNINSQTVSALNTSTVVPQCVVTVLGAFISGGSFTASADL